MARDTTKLQYWQSQFTPGRWPGRSGLKAHCGLGNLVRAWNLFHGTFSTEGLSIVSTVPTKGQMRWKIFDGALNADILIDFLRRLIKGATKKVFLILDNLRVHHNKLVKAWLAKHTEAIEVF